MEVFLKEAVEVTWINENGMWRGKDANGNEYCQPSNRETTSVETSLGFRGFGWTPEAALVSALEEQAAMVALKLREASNALQDLPLDLREASAETEGADWLQMVSDLETLASRLEAVV